MSGRGRWAQAQGAGRNRENMVRWAKVFICKGGYSRTYMHIAVHKDRSSCLSTGDRVTHRFHYHLSRCASKLTFATKRVWIFNSHQVGGNLIPVSLIKLCYSQPLFANLLLRNLLHREHLSALEQKISALKIPLADFKKSKMSYCAIILSRV